MQHLRGRIAKSDVPRTYVRTYVRTYASSTVSRHFGAETKKARILGECRTLWGEPERVVHAGAECAWSSCMCMLNVHGAVAEMCMEQ